MWMKIIKLTHFKWVHSYEMNKVEVGRNGEESSGYSEDRISSSAVADMTWYVRSYNESGDDCITCFKSQIKKC